LGFKLKVLLNDSYLSVWLDLLTPTIGTDGVDFWGVSVNVCMLLHFLSLNSFCYGRFSFIGVPGCASGLMIELLYGSDENDFIRSVVPPVFTLNFW